MKIRRPPLPLSVLLLHILVSVQAAAPIENVQGLTEGKASRNLETRPGSNPIPATSLQVKPTAAAVVKSKDAPIDGKDGRPHQGPFVETAAERDRKKAKESGEDEVPVSGRKPGPKDTPKAAGGPSKPMPESNDGVMDDPNRVGPIEGTRGTEGGISEKNRDRKAQGQIGSKSEVKPDSPKEVPPLPHSEQEKLSPGDGKGTITSDKGDVTQGEIGGLEVRVPTPYSQNSLS